MGGAHERVRQGARVARGDDVAGDALYDLLGDAPHIGGDDGQPRRHRLQGGVGTTRGLGDQREQVELTQERRGVADFARPFHGPAVRARPELRRVLRASALDATADAQEVRRHPSVRPSERVEQLVHLLPRVKASEGPDRERTIPVIRRRTGGGEEGHAVRDDVHGRVQRAPRALSLAAVLDDHAREARFVVGGRRHAGRAAGKGSYVGSRAVP